MARLPRFDLANVAQHIVQRGNDRQACFARDGDYERYLQELGEAALRFDCALHAYVLMTNHVHLLLTPSAMGAVSQLMQAIGRRYVGSFNARYRRTGSLWEGRFKSTLVDSERYVLTCHRYIELNPVRAGMVPSAGDYRWSSHAHNAGHSRDVRLSPHPSYLALGQDAPSRHAAYRQLFLGNDADAHVSALRQCTQQQRPFGSERFRAQIEALTQRCTEVRPRGRPRAKASGQ